MRRNASKPWRRPKTSNVRCWILRLGVPAIDGRCWRAAPIHRQKAKRIDASLVDRVGYEGSFNQLRAGERRFDEALRVLKDTLEMFFAAETFRVDLVDHLGAR